MKDNNKKQEKQHFSHFYTNSITLFGGFRKVVITEPLVRLTEPRNLGCFSHPPYESNSFPPNPQVGEPVPGGSGTRMGGYPHLSSKRVCVILEGLTVTTDKF